MSGQEAKSLLSRVYDDALDPGYSATAERGNGSSGSGSALRRSVTLAIALLAVGALATAVIVQTMRGAPDEDRTRTDLIDRVVTATAETDALAARVDELSAATASLRSDALSGNSADENLSARVGDLERAVGVDAVRGPGLEIVLDDGPPDPGGEGEPDLARVLDQDLQLTVNGLFAAGAEAASINGQRLTTLSAIRGAGDAVLVGYRPLSPPYVIAAIGDPSDMRTKFDNGPAAEQLRTLAQTYGITFDVRVQDELLLPGKPDLVLRYTTPKGAK